jgi:hypothetical protein
VKTFSRLVLSGCALFACAHAAFAAGEYQQTRDNKTTVWNATPKAGDTANWSGSRDKDNYATGYGDLTWYTAEGKVSGLYYGNMVHGKFEGAVNVHTGGRTLHAYFVDGGRVTGWARGRAPSKMQVPEDLVVERRKAEAKEPPPKKEPERAEPEPTPVVKKAKPVAEKIAKAEPTAQPTERPARGPETYHKETAKPPAVVEEKTQPLSAEEELKRTEPVTSTSKAPAYREPTPIPASEARAPESVPLPTAQPTERAVTESTPPPIQETPPVLHESPAAESSQPSSTPSDVSVNALVGPPSSLRTNSIPDTGAENKESQPPPKYEGPLTESEAINLADTEARTQGAPLDQYERPKVDHSAVKGKWSLFYARKSDASSGLPPAFSATVEDKTRKVEIRK